MVVVNEVQSNLLQRRLIKLLFVITANGNPAVYLVNAILYAMGVATSEMKNNRYLIC